MEAQVSQPQEIKDPREAQLLIRRGGRFRYGSRWWFDWWCNGWVEVMAAAKRCGGPVCGPNGSPPRYPDQEESGQPCKVHGTDASQAQWGTGGRETAEYSPFAVSGWFKRCGESGFGQWRVQANGWQLEPEEGYVYHKDPSWNQEARALDMAFPGDHCLEFHVEWNEGWWSGLHKSGYSSSEESVWQDMDGSSNFCGWLVWGQRQAVEGPGIRWVERKARWSKDILPGWSCSEGTRLDAGPNPPRTPTRGVWRRGSASRPLWWASERKALESGELSFARWWIALEDPKPRVMASEAEWNKIAGALYQRGLIRPIDSVAKVDDQRILNGAFGVPKPGKQLDDGRDVLRLIMDFRAVKFNHEDHRGRCEDVNRAPALQHIVLPAGHLLRISADDLVAAFYLFALPKSWSQLMAFQLPVKWSSLGFDKEGTTMVGASVLPMGWSSAVGLMQHAHRRIALRGFPNGGAGLLPGLEIRKDAVFPPLDCDGGAAWSLYLDDMTVIELLEEKTAKSLEGLPPEEQKRLRDAYSHWGIPVSKDKALERVRKAEKLERSSMERKDCSVVLQRDQWTAYRWQLPSWGMSSSKEGSAGSCCREVHSLQFRRPMFSILSDVWKEIGKDRPVCRMGSQVIGELLLLNCLQAMKFTDLKATLSEVVTASDACESGGGTVYSNRLSSRGLTEVVAIEEKVDDVKRWVSPSWRKAEHPGDRLLCRDWGPVKGLAVGWSGGPYSGNCGEGPRL